MTPGERWAQEELRRLRERGFTPSAIAAFLVASDARARVVRRERPELAGRARAWELTGAAAYALRAGAGGHGARDTVQAAVWWAAVCLMLDWHLGMVESEDGEPRNLGTADALTLLRAWLAPLIAADLDPRVLLLAAATDGLDGIAARASVPTRAGRDLEGLADAATVAAAMGAAARRGTLALPVLALELTRVGVGVGYAVAVYFARAGPPPPWVARAGRVVTPVRVAGLLAAATGRRRSADALVGGGSAASLVLLAVTAHRHGAARVGSRA